MALFSKFSKIEQKVAARFEARLVYDFDRMRDLYRKKFRYVLNTDSAKELCEEYSKSDEGRAQFSACIYQPAKNFINDMFKRECKNPKFEGVHLLSGGAGSGKSVFMKFVNITKALVLDGTLSSLTLAEKQLALAVSCGKMAEVTHVYCPLDKAISAALSRALKYGRTISLDAMADTHFYSQKTFLALVSENSNSDLVKFSLLNNSDYANPVLEKDLTFLLQREYIELREVRTTTHHVFQNCCAVYEEKNHQKVPEFIVAGFNKPGRSVV